MIVSTLALIATEVAKPMVEHALRNGATELNTEFIGSESAKLAVAIDTHLREIVGINYESSKICMKNIDGMISRHVASLKNFIPKSNV